jgi:hypothetical protein
MYIYNFEIQWDIYIIFVCLCGFVVSAERQERMLYGKDNVVLGFILDYLASLGSKVDKLDDQFHEFDKTQSHIWDELADLKKNGDLRQNDIDILKKVRSLFKIRNVKKWFRSGFP